MKDNVFWGILGVIIVAWLATFWFVGWAKKSEFEKHNSALEKKVKSMNSLARKPVEEFPTEELAQLREKEFETRKADLIAAMDVCANRDELFEKFFEGLDDPTVVAWQAKYSDLLRTLSDDYVQFAGLEEAPKFFAAENPQNQASLPDFQKRYNGFEAIVRAVMQYPGSTIERLEFEDKPKDLGRLGRSDHYDRKRWNVDVDMDAQSVTRLVNDLLGHDRVTFEVQRMIVAKSQRHLQKEVVVETKEALAEPPVRVRLILNALDWKYEPLVLKADDEDEEG